MPPHNAEDVKIIYLTEEGFLIGQLDYPSKLLISKDRGSTWSVFFDDDVNWNGEDYIKQDEDGNFWVAANNKLYRYESVNNLWVVHLSLSSFIFDYEFLENSNIVVATRDKKLTLYSFNGEILEEAQFSRWINKILIGKTDRHFAVQEKGTSRYFVEFNSDFSVIGEGCNNKAIGSDYWMLGDRILTNYAYSDDGNNWIVYPNNIGGEICIIDSSSIILIDYNEIYKSEDNGSSFTVIGELPAGHSVSSSDNFFSNNGIELFISEERFCSIEVSNYCSSGDLTEWIFIDSSIGNPYSNDIEYIADGDLLINTCRSFDLKYDASMLVYKAFENCEDSYEYENLSNGVLVSDSGCYSVNGGETWISEFDYSTCLLYTSPSPRDATLSRMPSSA